MRWRDVTAVRTSGFGDVLIRRTPGIYRRFRALLARSENASRAVRESARERLTAKALRHARKSAYARARGMDGFYERWSILEKDVLREQGSALACATWLPAARAETGGSTGIPIALRRSWASVVFEQAVLDHLVARHGGVEWRSGRIAVLRGDTIKDPSDTTPPFWRRQHGGKYLALSSNHLHAATVACYIEVLKEFRPDILWVYPSSLEALCRLTGTMSLLIPGLKIVVSSSEVMTPELHSEAAHVFQVPVLDYYGQAERVCLSYSIDGRNHYFVPVYGRVDFRHSHDEDSHALHEIIGTSYWNAAQPLVRYATEDLVRIPKGQDETEMKEIALGLRPHAGISGRQSDYLLSPDGGRLVGINHIPRGVPDIAQMQFRQHSPCQVEINVVPLATYSKETEQLIMKKARQKIPASMKIEIVPVNRLQRTARGKAPLIARACADGDPNPAVDR
jgi:phenylacetate-CoA ligase